MKKSKKLMALLLATGMALSVAGCSSSDTGSSSSAAGSAGEDASSALTSEEVVFWGPWDGEVGGQIEAIIDEYNTEKGTNVSYVCQADLVNAYQAAALAGDVPDIMLWDANEVRRYAKMGQLKSIDEELKADGIDTADFNDESIKELTYEDHLYGLPMNIDIWGLYVNMDILNEAGIDKAPATWDELKEAAVASMDVEGVKVGLNMKMAPTLFNSFLVANNGQPLSDDGMTVNLDDRALEVLEFFQELIDAGAYNTSVSTDGSNEIVSQMTAGDAFMVIDCSSRYTAIKKADPECPVNISVFPARDTKDTKIMLWPGTNLNVNANAANPEECLEFISYVTGSEGSSAWLEAAGGSEISVAQLSDTETWPEHFSQLETYADTVTMIPVVNWPSSGSANALGEGIAGMLAGVKSVDNVLADMDANWGK